MAYHGLTPPNLPWGFGWLAEGFKAGGTGIPLPSIMDPARSSPYPPEPGNGNMAPSGGGLLRRISDPTKLNRATLRRCHRGLGFVDVGRNA